MNKALIARNAACDAVTGLVDQGLTYASGRLQIYADNSSLITWLPFSVPAFQDATDGTAVANMITDSTAFIDGTAMSFTVVNRGAIPIWSGSVVQTGYVGDMHLAQVIFPADSTISISSAIYVVPA